MEGKIKNKTTLLLVLSFLISLLFVNFVCADIIVDSEDLVLEMNYDELEDDEDKLEISQKITLTNNGTAEETVTLSLLEFSSSYKNMEVSPASLVLVAGATGEVTFSGDVPVNLDQGIHDEIGSLVVDDIKHKISANVVSMLEVEKIYIFVNGYDKKTIDEDKENVKDLAPNDEVELKFRLKNLFDPNYDNGDIDGTIYVTLDNDDFGDEIDEEEDFDIDADEELSSEDEMISVKFTIPSNAAEETYNLEIKVESEDENEAVYITEWEIELEVEREKNDVRVEELTITPAKVDCHRSFKIVTEIENYGTDSQKHVVLELFGSELNEHIQEIPEFKLDRGTEDDSSVLKQQYMELPLDFSAGTYELEATVYYDYTKFADRKTIELVVEDCATAEPEEDETEADIETNTNGSDEQNETDGGELITSSEVVDTIEDPYTPEDIIFAILLIGIILIVFMMIVFFIMLIK